LHDEWTGLYPNLEIYCELLRGRSDRFRIREINEAALVSLMEDQWADLSNDDPVGKLTNEYLGSRRSFENVISQVLKLLYTVSAIGIKNSTADRPRWSYLEDRGVADNQFKGDAVAYIHPMLWRSLDVTPPKRSETRKK